jgi:CheY-like chemotaxis protein
MHHTSTILAIEPDPERAGTVRDLVVECLDADVIVAESIEDAVGVLSERLPDLILASALLSPRDTSDLTWHLKQRSRRRVPVLTIPPMLEARTVPRSSLRAIFHRRPAAARPYADAFAARIRSAFAQSAASGERVDEEPPPYSPPGQIPAVQLRRAHRWMGEDVYWLSGMRVLPAFEVRLVNLSSHGVLLESARDFMPGSVLTFELLAASRRVTVSGRVVRSGPAAERSGSARYHSAVEFEGGLDLPALRGAAPRRPDSVGGLVARVRSVAERGAGRDAVRAALEVGLTELLVAREVRFHAAPMDNDSDDSVCVRVPTDADHQQLLLHATFEPHHTVTKDEVAALNAAASEAADLV